MQIRVTYNKTDGTISIENDTKLVTVEVNNNATEDTADSLFFELAVDTTAYEIDSIMFPEELTEEIEE
jgi:hypothetical protein